MFFPRSALVLAWLLKNLLINSLTLVASFEWANDSNKEIIGISHKVEPTNKIKKLIFLKVCVKGVAVSYLPSLLQRCFVYLGRSRCFCARARKLVNAPYSLLIFLSLPRSIIFFSFATNMSISCSIIFESRGLQTPP